MGKKNNSRWRFLIGVLLVGLLLGSVELVMRLTGHFLQRPSSLLNRISPDDESKLRILTLGESTTADFFAKGTNSSWPRQLETLLRERGISARVYNEGLAGTQSAFILGRLPEFLSIYRPHIVITMMGVNDVPGIVYDDTFLQKVAAQFYQIRLVKLWNWSMQVGRGLFTSCRIKGVGNTKLPGPEMAAYLKQLDSLIEKGFSLSSRLSVESIETELRKSVSDDSTLAFILDGIAMRIRGDFSEKDRATSAAPFLERAFALDPRDRMTIFWILNDHPSAAQCSRVIRSLSQCLEQLPDDLLSPIFGCFVAHPSLTEERILWSRRIGIENGGESATARHYRLLHSMLRDAGVAHIAMQYPTRPLSELQSYFPDSPGPEQDDIVFVSNEFNFLRVLANHRYKEVFSDRFAKTWGHTTPFGHRLIAEGLVPEIERLLSSKKFAQFGAQKKAAFASER